VNSAEQFSRLIAVNVRNEFYCSSLVVEGKPTTAATHRKLMTQVKHFMQEVFSGQSKTEDLAFTFHKIWGDRNYLAASDQKQRGHNGCDFTESPATDDDLKKTAKRMTPTKIAEAQQTARDWINRHPRLHKLPAGLNP
jgi:hypothetical protein